MKTLYKLSSRGNPLPKEHQVRLVRLIQRMRLVAKRLNMIAMKYTNGDLSSGHYREVNGEVTGICDAIIGIQGEFPELRER